MPLPTASRSWVDHYAALLRECGDRRALREGRIIHARLLAHGDGNGDGDGDGDASLLLGNLVVDMYAKCRSVAEARRAFDVLGSRKNVYSWSIIISAYAQCGHFRDALHLFRAMDLDGVAPNAFTLSSVVAACGGAADPRQALRIHARIVATGFGGHQFVATATIVMFGRCQGCWIHARAVFLGMASRSVVAWNAVIAAAVRAGEEDQALELLHRMDNDGIKPDEFTLTTILPACSSARHCRQCHDRIRASGFESMLAVQNALVDCYGRCGRLLDAEAVFDAMIRRDVISWTSLIASYVHNDESRRALALFERMDVEPNVCTFTAVAEACSVLGVLDTGLALQARITSSGMGDSAELGAALVAMFVRCGSWIHAKAVLDAMCATSVAAWSLVISAAARDPASPGRALELLAEMALGGTKADAPTLAAAMSSACMGLDRGRSLHLLARDAGLDRENSVGAALITMYSRAGMPGEAREAFERISDKGVMAWSSLMAGYAHLGHNRLVLELYHEMIEVAGVEPDKHALSTILAACAELGAGDEGVAAHSRMVASIGLECDVVLGTSLLDMYARSGAIRCARRVFDGMPDRNARTWTALIAGLARHGRGDDAVACLHAMSAQGVEPDAVTLTTILQGCSHGGLLAAARRCFRLLCGEYGAPASCEHLECLIDLLGRAGRLPDAERLAADAIPASAQEPARRILLGGCRIHGDLGVAKRAVGVQGSDSYAPLLSAIFSDDAALSAYPDLYLT